MSLTRGYTRLHLAFRSAARMFGTEPLAARIALAVAERGGEATTEQIYADLGSVGAQVRRQLGRMYESGLAIGTGAGGGRRRPGVHVRVRLTASGNELAQLVGRYLRAVDLEAAA